MINNFRKYRELILYLFFGICTTLVNIFTYHTCSRLVHLNTVESTFVAWIVSVLFAYITNRIFVFCSNEKRLKGILLEFFYFIACRFLSGLIDIAVMYVSVDLMGVNDMLMKIASNVIVVVINYIASKLIIFRDNKNVES